MEAPDTLTRSTANGVTVEDATKHIASLDSAAAVDAFVAGDERKGVQQAAETRKAELSAASPPSTSPPSVNPLSDEASPEAAEGKPLEAGGGSGTVKVRTRYPISEFDPRRDDLPMINSAGVEVERSKVADLIEAAATAGTTLEEVA